jgi:hypothetical protein
MSSETRLDLRQRAGEQPHPRLDPGSQALAIRDVEDKRARERAKQAGKTQEPTQRPGQAGRRSHGGALERRLRCPEPRLSWPAGARRVINAQPMIGEPHTAGFLHPRIIRFYTTKGLVPDPIRRGRTGSAPPTTSARARPGAAGVRLRALGDREVRGRHPRRREPEDIALQRTMLAPRMAQAPMTMSRAELNRRTGRRLSDDDLAAQGARVARPAPAPGRFTRRYEVASQLSVALGLLDLGFPLTRRQPHPTCTPPTVAA